MGQKSSKTNPSYDIDPQKSSLKRPKIRLTDDLPRKLRFANTVRNLYGNKIPLGTMRGYFPENSPNKLNKYNFLNLPLVPPSKVTFPPQLARTTGTNSIRGGARKTRRRRHSRK